MNDVTSPYGLPSRSTPTPTSRAAVVPSVAAVRRAAIAAITLAGAGLAAGPGRPSGFVPFPGPPIS